MTLKKKRDRNSDGYFYVDTKNVLYPGTLYELSVRRFRQRQLIKDADVFTGNGLEYRKVDIKNELF